MDSNGEGLCLSAPSALEEVGEPKGRAAWPACCAGNTKTLPRSFLKSLQEGKQCAAEQEGASSFGLITKGGRHGVGTESCVSERRAEASAETGMFQGRANDLEMVRSHEVWTYRRVLWLRALELNADKREGGQTGKTLMGTQQQAAMQQA